MLKYIKLLNKEFIIMFKIFFLVFNILIVSPAFSSSLNHEEDLVNHEEESASKFVFSSSGFITTTFFSQSHFYEDTKEAALNLDLLYDSYSIRGQLTTNNPNHISRLTFEKNTAFGEDRELLVKIGRFPRLVSFYNNLTDSPSAYDVAMIPLGVYTRRLIKSQAFSAIDGVSLIYTLTDPVVNDKVVKLYLNYGQVPLDNQCTVQQEYRYDKCLPGYEFQSDTNDYDIGISYEKDNLTLIASNTNIQFKTKLLNPKDPVSNFLVKRTNRLIANVTKVGFKYDTEKYLLQGEYSYHNYSVNNLLQGTISIHKENTAYLLGEYKWTSKFSTNVQYSYGSSAYLGQYNDKSIGINYVMDNTTISLEYHRGTGVEWKRYLAVSPDWNSAVLTVSYTF